MPADFTVPDFEEVVERFTEDICSSIEAFNEAAKIYGKELHALSANPLLEKMNIEVSDLHTVH